MRNLKLTLICLGGLIAACQQASAGTVYHQGFETNSNGWFDSSNGWYGELTRVDASGGGIAASQGNFYAKVLQDSSSAPYSNFAGSNDGMGWTGGNTVSLDIYLDTEMALGEGFDYSVALSKAPPSAPPNDHLRDFIFHVTKDTDTGKLLVGGSNNTNYDPREDLETLHNYEVKTSGWYTFEHQFRDDGGVLFTDLNLRDSSGNLLFTETRGGSVAGGGLDLISDVGDVRYSWLTNIDVAGGIAIDNHLLTSAVPEPTSLAIFAIGIAGVGFNRRRRA
ncbi:PEP-CTERM sorting domain-containing protein [Stieleria sp. TO1_6]|uniref:PEP-CTERM sorting domain-containing protein n=1 Tax=Stieleria tagensis TaxID=2956795 RepID=UPI00209B2C8B|nr:PEP-CTERM sorting domain-containing protein [Stieleria tagensis]MCO8123277.1 PEP-CTERM sorting domain-containing protein [Stieleria tagensis]